MSSSLGFRNGGEFAPRPKPSSVVSRSIEIERDVAAQAYCSVCGFKITCPVPQGLLMTLLFFAGALALPIMFFYIEPDYGTTWVEPFIIGMSALYAVFLLFLSSNMSIFYNTVLGLYTGVEVRVLHRTFDFAVASTTSNAHMAWAISGGAIVILHLLPFYLVDSGVVVTTLAAVGLVVNTALCVYLDPTLTLQAFSSGTAFLLTAMCIIGLNCAKCSLLTLLRDAMKYGGFLTLQPLTFKL
jgi:hypothetical protein